MFVSSLSVNDFRNIEYAALNFSPHYNIFTGNNGHGKTNTVEALYLTLTGKSHRESSLENFIMYGKGALSCCAEVVDDRALKLKCTMSINEKGKSHFINGENIKTRQELLNNFSLVFFSPEDLRLIKDSPQLRRNFMNDAISVLYPRYNAILSDYNKVLKQRNVLLKGYSPSAQAMLEVYDEALSQSGSDIIRYRIKLLKDISEAAQSNYEKISGGSEVLSLSYVSNVLLSQSEFPTLCETYLERLSETRRDDIMNVSTGIGVHHDDMNVFLNGRSARKFASQGQQRSIALCLKLALCELIEQIKGQKPVVLLDDVMSELDEKRRKSIIELLRGKQVFITCAGVDFETDKDNTAFFYAEDGRIEALNINDDNFPSI